MRKGADKLQKFLNSKQQGRLDGFFSVQPKDKAPVVAKGKGKDKKIDTKTKGTKRKVSLKMKIIRRLRLPIFILFREKRKRKAVQERNLERNDAFLAV